MNIDILILNYNGEKLLPECLPSIIEAKKQSKHSVGITIIDNESTDRSLEALKEFSSEVTVIEHKNEVYSSFNDVAERMNGDVIIIMNNDIRIDKNYIDPIVEPFEERGDVLFVAAKGYSFNGDEYQGDRSIASMKRGYIEPLVNYPGYEQGIDKMGYTFSAGVGAFDRKKFLELKGYDPVYLPGRVEDVDLCYRGWKKGYVGIYQPKSVHYHKGGDSFNEKFSNNAISTLVFKNNIVFMVKNITDIMIFLRFIGLLFCFLGYYTFTGKLFFWRGFFGAVRIIPEILKSRKNAIKGFVLKDKEVLNKINGAALGVFE